MNIQAIGAPGADWKPAPGVGENMAGVGEGMARVGEGATGVAEGAGPAGEGALGIVGAGERVQRLQTLISQVERGAGGFAAALQAAQSTGNAGAAGAAGAAGSTATDIGLAGGATTADAGLAGTTATEAGVATSGADPAVASAVGAEALPATLYSSAGAGTVTTAGAGTIPSAGAGTIPTADVTPAASSTTTGSGAVYASLIQEAAIRNGVEPALLHGLIEQESGFDPSATSSAGAQGLTQLMPSTAASLGVTEPLDPTQSIEGGARLLGELMRQFGGNTGDALAAYNAGAGAVRQYGGIPPYPETEQYVTKVLANAEAYRQSMGATEGAAPATAGEVYATAGGTRA